MTDYNIIFKGVKLEEAYADSTDSDWAPEFDEQGQEQGQDTGEFSGSDSDAWDMNNPDIVNDEGASAVFNIDGLDKAEIEKYSQVIDAWNNGIEGAIQQLSQILKFAATERLNDAPGSDEFKSLIRDAPKLKRDLSAFQSQVEDLQQIIKLAIKASSKERRDKFNSLQN